MTYRITIYWDNAIEQGRVETVENVTVVAFCNQARTFSFTTINGNGNEVASTIPIEKVERIDIESIPETVDETVGGES